MALPLVGGILNIGSLNKKIELQYSTKTPDGLGGFTTVFVTTATVFAAIWPVSATETVQAGAQTMTVTHRIRIRYRSVIRSSWRIKHEGKYYNIVSIIDPSMAHKYLDLMCKEVA
jgi:SPP1 family predicted phage head-tail adaptor